MPAPVTSEASTDIRFFDLLGQAMQQMLPVAADSNDAFVASLHQIGLSAGNGFEWRALDESVKRGLARAASAGEQIVDARWQATGEVKNGWRYTTGGGPAGYDFALRAALAKNQFGAQLAQQVLYPNAQVDDKAEPYHASVRTADAGAQWLLSATSGASSSVKHNLPHSLAELASRRRCERRRCQQRPSFRGLSLYAFRG